MRSTDMILVELRRVFAEPSIAEDLRFQNEITGAQGIVCLGAGRVGLALAGFSKRLRHLGKEAFWHADVTLPRMGSGDLLIVGSGSGETRTIVCLAQIAKDSGMRVALVTCSPKSSLKDLADASVVLNCPSKTDPERAGGSAQPMTTLFEQAVQIYLDATVLDLMQYLSLSNSELEQRHSTLE